LGSFCQIAAFPDSASLLTGKLQAIIPDFGSFSTSADSGSANGGFLNPQNGSTT
jgi:hypothetical protein